MVDDPRRRRRSRPAGSRCSPPWRAAPAGGGAARAAASARRPPPARAPRRIAGWRSRLAAGGRPSPSAPLARGRAARPRRRRCASSFLDVGQGDATLIQRDGARVLVDTGRAGRPDPRAAARRPGVDRLDALVLTHAEADHEGAALAVIARFRPRADRRRRRGLAVGRPARAAAAAAAGARTAAARRGETIALGRLRFQVLWPPRAPAGLARRPATRTTARWSRGSRPGRSRCCSPADAESPRHAPLRPASRWTCSRSPTTAAPTRACPRCSQRLRPQLAAIEVGAENTYGHPAPSTLAALARAVPTVVRTDRDGTVRLSTPDDGRGSTDAAR